MHVLTATPCNRLEPETIRALFTQTYAESLSQVFMRDNPEPVPSQNILRAYRRLREVFLAGPYDALWIVENDVIPPPDALAKLLAVPADIVYGVYLFRRGTPVINVMHPHTRNSITDNPTAWAIGLRAGAVVDCGGLGFGCTLIRRPVLERLDFRTLDAGGDADSCLAVDAPLHGFSQAAHLGVVCGHKRPDGVTLWPAGARPFFVAVGVSTPRLVQVHALRAFADFGTGAPVLYMPGDSAAIDFELAASLQGAGVIEYSEASA
jgi:hypothetical protein